MSVYLSIVTFWHMIKRISVLLLPKRSIPSINRSTFQNPIRPFFTMSRINNGPPKLSFQRHLSINGNKKSTEGVVQDPSSLTSNTKDTYEEAIRRLNALQSNAQTLQQWMQIRNELTIEEVSQDTIRFVERGGLTISQMETLNVIHVAGTKGKGTTCAFIESILREAGLRTGFYSSPHLVSVRERIRINGKPLSKDQFCKYFFHTYRNMENTKEADEDEMPAYFRFLTCMGLYAFFHENVDVVILEVGIGGAYDATNCIKKPVITGITSLGLEHQSVLGNSIEEITLAKAGIMKPNVPCFTISHLPEVTKILEEYAAAVNCPLIVVPPFKSYGEEEPLLGVDDGIVSRINASIAIQLSNAFLHVKVPELLKGWTYTHGKPFPLLRWHRDGLRNCVWHGRFQVLQRNPDLTCYLDGAHTVQSLDAALNWFTQQTSHSSNRILVFSVTGDRDSAEMLGPFSSSDIFQLALFCPLVTLSSPAKPAGASNGISSYNWSILTEGEDVMRRSTELSSVWMNLYPEGKSHILPSVNHVVEYLDKISQTKKTDVFITGSLHLVGRFLSLLDPQISES